MVNSATVMSVSVVPVRESAVAHVAGEFAGRVLCDSYCTSVRQTCLERAALAVAGKASGTGLAAVEARPTAWRVSSSTSALRGDAINI